VSTGSAESERFDPSRHDVTAFDCGDVTLNRWLSRYAGQSDRRDAARTFVTTRRDGGVLGYYTVVAGQLRHEEATAAVSRDRTRQFPIPIALLARLAVDTNHQRQGLGAALLRDALSRAQAASAQVAVRAVVVHAIDDSAAAFYARFGFRDLAATPRTLMVTLAELRAAGY
jgi:GNAT superfamily N-acetyltransferase